MPISNTRWLGINLKLGNHPRLKIKPFNHLTAFNRHAAVGEGRVLPLARHEAAPWRRLDGVEHILLHAALFAHAHQEWTAFDQYYSHRQKQKLVVANFTVRPENMPEELVAGKVYVLDGRERDATAMEVAVADLDAQFAAAGLRAAPLGELR